MRVIITKRFLLCMLLSAFTALVSAQQRTITGTVKDEKGEPVPFASFVVKGTKTGGQTASNGSFRVVVPGNTAILVFSFVGYKTKEVPVGSASTLSISLEASENALTEVVVTALGIKRDRKSLGYAVQEVKGPTLVEAREPNMVNALSGKIAGLQITKSSNGPAGSSKITLRGNNSLTGDNQPLIVVDGVPVTNFTGAINSSTGKSNNDFYNPAADMGNGLGDINPEDIENISVLKGPSAAALYGSRAGNGVIMITTKTGKLQKGLGITIASTLGVESIFTQPKLQDVFGQGNNGNYDRQDESSWGAKAEGQTVENWNGEQIPLRIYDNIGNYMNRGISSNQNLSFQQQLGATSIYTSINRLDDKSIIPGTELHRTNMTARAVSSFGKDDRWVTDTKIQYINSDAENRPNNGRNVNNVFAALYGLPRSLDIRQFENSTNENGQMVWYRSTTNEYNPYWAKEKNLNNDVRNRYIMTGSVKYNFNKWLNAEVRGGMDNYTTTVEGKHYAGSRVDPTGSYSLSKQTFTETNFSALLSGRQDNLVDRLGGGFTLGGNLMKQKDNTIGASSGQLVVPDLFFLNNGVNSPSVSQFYREKKISSVYGSLQANWDGYLFLEGTFRNDWSSALSSTKRSYFYPSVSLSYVFSEMFTRMGKTLPSWFTYGKLRSSYASVGNDMPAYQLYNTYVIGKDPNQNTTARRDETLYDPNVVNELIKNYEAGLEMRFFNSRIGLDFSFYKSNATNQLIDLPMDPLSGYKYRKINAGNIQNKGLELVLDGEIFPTSSALRWNAAFNFAHNNNTIESLTDDVTIYPLGGYDVLQIVAETGKKYGEIYGTSFNTVPDGPNAGKLLLDASGRPTPTSLSTRLGNQQPDYLAGITNNFSYKGFNLSFLIDGRFGGKIFSGSLAALQLSGAAANTVVNGARDKFVVDGYILNTTSKQYEKSNVEVTPEDYWTAVAGANNIGITEANLYDATNIRLRNINLSYNLSTKFLSNTPVQRAKIGISCNNVWLITSHMHGIDPESVYATAGNATGFENSSAPTTRTFSFNLTLGF